MKSEQDEARAGQPWRQEGGRESWGEARQGLGPRALQRMVGFTLEPAERVRQARGVARRSPLEVTGRGPEAGQGWLGASAKTPVDGGRTEGVSLSTEGGG